MRTLGAFLLVATCALYTNEASAGLGGTPLGAPTAPLTPTTTSVNPTTTGYITEAECEMSPCPETLDPVCYAEGRVQFQAANFCEFKNKVRCGLKTGKTYRLLYSGPCLVRKVLRLKKV